MASLELVQATVNDPIAQAAASVCANRP